MQFCKLLILTAVLFIYHWTLVLFPVQYKQFYKKHSHWWILVYLCRCFSSLSLAVELLLLFFQLYQIMPISFPNNLLPTLEQLSVHSPQLILTSQCPSILYVYNGVLSSLYFLISHIMNEVRGPPMFMGHLEFLLQNAY